MATNPGQDWSAETKESEDNNLTQVPLTDDSPEDKQQTKPQEEEEAKDPEPKPTLETEEDDDIEDIPIDINPTKPDEVPSSNTELPLSANKSNDDSADLAPKPFEQPSQEGSSSSPSQHKKTASTSSVHHYYINSVVSDPQKEQDGSQNAYISYLITTETNSPTFQSSHPKVRRRFSDFFFLYTFLFNEYPACAVPPLPDKSRLEYIKGDRFGPEFTLKRATSLNRFLTRISLHPILRKSDAYVYFLESNEWHAYRKSLAARHQTAIANGTMSGDGVLDNLSDSLLNAFSKVNTVNDEFVEVKEKMDKLDENLIQVEKSLMRVVRRQGDLSHDLDDLSQQLIRLAGIETNLDKELVAFANGTAFMSRAYTTLRDQTDADYIVSLRDLQNYVTCIKALLKLREQKQLDQEALIDYLNKAVSEKQSIISGSGSKNFFRARIEDVRGIDHQNAKAERLKKLDIKIEHLTHEVENVKKSSETFHDLALNEIAIFENTKATEMKETLNSLADNHIEFYQSLINEWNSLLAI